MRKFKLIKEYPGSPKLETIIDLNTMCWIGNDWLKAVKTSPEFWQEIVEKDYEILSFRNIGFENNGSYDEAVLKNDGLYHLISSNYNIHRKETLNSMILKNNFKIHSVKRLSDGEVFTIGDICKTTKSEHTLLIYEIVIIDDVIRFNCGNVKGVHCTLHNEIYKVKQPLFTTEDGVDIYESGKYLFHVKIPSFTLFEKSLWNIHISKEYFKYNKYFSTKETAEKYILMNKPCLSINDILNHNVLTGKKVEHLEKLVQQKLNK